MGTACATRSIKQNSGKPVHHTLFSSPPALYCSGGGNRSSKLKFGRKESHRIPSTITRCRCWGIPWSLVTRTRCFTALRIKKIDIHKLTAQVQSENPTYPASPKSWTAALKSFWCRVGRPFTFSRRKASEEII